MPGRMLAFPAGRLVVGLSLSLAACDAEGRSEARSQGDAVRLEVDAGWPQPFPENWVRGDVTGLAVDSRDHVWVLSPPDPLTPEEQAAAGAAAVRTPTVLELDTEGRPVREWAAPTGELAWPVTPHGIFVDHAGYVWIGYRDDHRVVKFTRDGAHVLTIGERGVTGGSNDPQRLGAPASVWVDPETNEAFVADGYRNRRIVVYDGETGAYLRHWGAYGEAPDDDDPPGAPEEGSPPRQFSTVHGVTGSRDGRIYVADRRGGRIQVFERSGAFVAERVLPPTAGDAASTYDVALSSDPEQRFVYVADGNGKVWVLRRDGLDVIGEIGSAGEGAGQFVVPHNLAVDSRGHLYTGEARGQRVQRFRPGGSAKP